MSESCPLEEQDLSGDPRIAGPGVALAGLVFAVFAVTLVLMCLGKVKASFRRTIGWVALLAWLGAALRVVWWALEMTQRAAAPLCLPAVKQASYVLNRLAWLFTGMAFLVLVIGWMDAFHSINPPSKTTMSTFFRVLLFILLPLLAVITIVLLVAAFTFCEVRFCFVAP